MDQPRFVIEASEAEEWAKQSNLTVLQLLPSIVEDAKTLARPLISNYYVGAVAVGSSGRIFSGVNLEFSGLPLNQSVHAEQFLITNLILNAESRIKYFVTSSAPCGHCRQFLQEIRNAPDINLLICDSKDKIKPSDTTFTPLSHFLPHRFGPNDLLEKEAPLLLDPRHNGLSLKSQKICNGICGRYAEKIDGQLKVAALEAANMAHAPYSKCPSGVALMDSEGKIYKGFYMESAAYNPSLGPVQAALVAYITGGGEGYERIVAAALVEKEGAKVVQEHTARLILQLISPKCAFRVFHCQSD